MVEPTIFCTIMTESREININHICDVCDILVIVKGNSTKKKNRNILMDSLAVKVSESARMSPRLSHGQDILIRS